MGSFSNKFLRYYFNSFYNPLYDFTTGHLYRYRQLQKECIELLTIKDNDRILCAGLGTGNEITAIYATQKQVNIVGIDYSEKALKKASIKASRSGKSIQTVHCDIQDIKKLPYKFDKLLCIHVMDFVDNPVRATNSILKWLKPGGKFCITYPSRSENAGMTSGLIKDNFRNISKTKNKLRQYLSYSGRLLAGMVYIPIYFRKNKHSFEKSDLTNIFHNSNVHRFIIEEDKLYCDYIVYGIR